MDYQYCAMLMSLTALLLGLSHVVTGTVSVEDISDGDKKIVVLDENANFKCTGASSQDLEWTHTGIIGEVILEDGPPYVINVATVGSQTLSLLTIEGVQMEDAGTLTCRDVQDNNDKVSFTLEVSETAVEDPPANWQTPEIQLDNPDASVVEFDGVVAPTLKCVGGALGSELVFLRDGDVLVDGATDTITSAQDVNSGLQTVMLTPAPIAGHYTCRDTTYPGSDSDSVELVVNTNPTIVFEIVEPAGEEEFRVLAGGSFSVRCRGALGAEIVWYQGETLLEDELGGFLITDSEDVSAGTVTSLLTKEDSEVSDSGLYACVNSLDNDQRDEIQIDVQQPEYLPLGSSFPTEYRQVIMRVGTTVTLECSLESPGNYQPEWSKDNEVICSGPKYSITMDTKPSSLVVKNTDRTDPGLYRCVFKHRETGQIGGIIVFNVSALPCPHINSPVFGSIDKCPSQPLHGDSCLFKCHPEFKLSNTVPLICEQRGGLTYWSGRMPTCIRIPPEELEATMPTSLSHVLLQVGWDLELRCSHPATWNKNGDRIRHGDKFHVKNGHLVIRKPDKLDVGVYDCLIRDPSNSHMTGIQKFNVTTLPCPKLQAPENGSFVQCSSRPVYGETCIFRCNRGLRLTGNKSRTCVLTALTNSNTQVHWTGGEAKCIGRYTTNMKYQSASAPVTSPPLSHLAASLVMTSLIHLVTE